jgi:cation-transporting ATPase E
VSQWSSRGYRVLLLAAYDGTPEPENLEKEKVTPLALIPMTNRIRPEAPDTFRYFAQQGVAVKVISGDNPVTVSEVARQAGIPDADLYVDGKTLETDEDIEEAAEHYAVFGRVTPEQKRKLIQAMQQAGHTVAMTGDGVNDVLALKDADCGIAMASGAEAACQVAQLVLLDSDFSTMPQVVDEGRRVINNIQRAASLFFVKNIFSFLITLVSLFVDMPYPLVPLHLSVISGLTIGIPAFFLALEPNHERVKGRFITNVFLKALPGGLTNVFLILLIEAFVAVFGFPTDQLHTMSAVVLAVVGLRVLYQAARPVDWKRGVLIAVMAMAELISFTVLAPVFDFTAPTLETGLVLAVFMMLSFQIMRTVLAIFEKLEQLRSRPKSFSIPWSL